MPPRYCEDLRPNFRYGARRIAYETLWPTSIPVVSPAVLSHDAGMHTCRCGADTTRSMWDPYGDIYATIMFINSSISHWLSKDLVSHVHVL